MTDLTLDPEAPVQEHICADHSLPAPVAVPAFTDNYLWLKPVSDDCALAVDPGDADAIEQALEHKRWMLAGIVLTHHHPDHTGGAVTLARRHQVAIYGPADPRLQATHRVASGDILVFDRCRLQVLDLAGHTSSHIGWLDRASHQVFVGDTLFALGCGRLFEGSPAQMWAALMRLAALPPQTEVYAAHEYTEVNLRFARWLFPDDPALRAEELRIAGLLSAGVPTLPTLLARELALNPFLRMRDARWRQLLSAHGVPDEPIAAFARVRQLKDQFQCA